MPDDMTQKIQLTADGKKELEKELQELEEVKLPAIIKRVEIARANGDLSENAEYSNAKEDQQLIETRIAELKDILANAHVVKQSNGKSGKVMMGSKVTVKMAKAKKVVTIVGEFESNPLLGKVSSVSPLGAALMGHVKGDSVMVKAPAGDVSYEILDVA